MTSVQALIFDLDGTLVDSSALDEMRKAKDWRGCVRAVGRLKPFDEMDRLIARLQEASIPFAVVTASVSYYANSVLKHLGIAPAVVVAYHDTVAHKPDPAPVRAALTALKISDPGQVLALGDSPTDFQAYQRAGVVSGLAGWASSDTSAWDHSFARPRDVWHYIVKSRAT